MPIHSVKLCQHTDRHLGNLSKQTMCGVSSGVVSLLYWFSSLLYYGQWDDDHYLFCLNQLTDKGKEEREEQGLNDILSPGWCLPGK